jgi:hypothetical protein
LTGSCFEVQSGLKLTILLLQPLEWMLDYRCVPPCPAFFLSLWKVKEKKIPLCSKLLTSVTYKPCHLKSTHQIPLNPLVSVLPSVSMVMIVLAVSICEDLMSFFISWSLPLRWYINQDGLVVSIRSSRLAGRLFTFHAESEAHVSGWIASLSSLLSSRQLLGSKILA